MLVAVVVLLVLATIGSTSIGPVVLDEALHMVGVSSVV